MRNEELHPLQKPTLPYTPLQKKQKNKTIKKQNNHGKEILSQASQ